MVANRQFLALHSFQIRFGCRFLVYYQPAWLIRLGKLRLVSKLRFRGDPKYSHCFKFHRVHLDIDFKINVSNLKGVI